MRRILGGAAVAVLALTALPAVAAEPQTGEPEVLAPCALPAGAERLTVDGFGGTIPTPSFVVGNETESLTFVLDLAGAPVGTTADLTARTTWLVPANDYDLELLAGPAGGTSENYQPFDEAVEEVYAGRVAHCREVTVTAIDYLAPVVVDTIDLGITVATVAAPAKPVTAPSTSTAPVRTTRGAAKTR